MATMLRTERSGRRALALAAIAVLSAALPASRTGSAQTPPRSTIQPVTPTHDLRVAVDRRVEVLSILYALAGASEYTNGPSTPYRAAMIAHFRPLLQHPAVAATRALRARGIGHDAPMRLAFYLDDTLHAIRPLTPSLPGLERFAGVDMDGYLDAVRRFAADSSLDDFLRAQQGQARDVEQRFADFIRGRPFVAWFDGLFGARAGATYRLVPGMVTGLMSYGGFAQRSDDGQDVVIVVSLDDLDAGGLPQPGDLARMLVVHELAHSYVNPIIEAAPGGLEAMAAPIVARSATMMQRQSYPTTRIVLQESIVRALVVMYMRDVVDEAHRQGQLRYEEARGFLWTSDLVEALTRARGAHRGRLTPALLVDAVRQGLAAFQARVPAT